MDDFRNQKHPLEGFPRGDLYEGITRRQFFSALRTELHLYANRANGAAAIRIPTLGSMPDEQLADLIPAILPECKAHLHNGEVWATIKGKTDPVFLFPVDSLTLFTFNLMNGKQSIRQIADRLAFEKEIPGSRAFAFVRGLFLSLVKAGACLPNNNPFNG